MSSEPKARQILFRAEMVHAILNKHKTQTRRVFRDQDAVLTYRYCDGRFFEHKGYPVGHGLVRCPYGEPGERLWVKEAFRYTMEDRSDYYGAAIEYKAWWDLGGLPLSYRSKDTPDKHRKDDGSRWRPSIFMPRWASRITLEIVAVRIEPLQNITLFDLRAEGIRPDREAFFHYDAYIVPFHNLWEKINAKRGYGWESNPWVWVVEFSRLPNDERELAA